MRSSRKIRRDHGGLGWDMYRHMRSLGMMTFTLIPLRTTTASNDASNVAEFQFCYIYIHKF